MINSLQSFWEERKCPAMNGVIYCDGFVDRVMTPPPLTDRSLRIEFFARASIEKGEAGHVFTLGPLCRAEDRESDTVAVAGEGGWGGDGFVAVTDFSNRIRWIALFDFSNPFVSLEIKNSEIVAVNNHGDKWRFFLPNPTRIVVDRLFV